MASFWVISTRFVTEAHLICQSGCHLLFFLFPTKLQTFLQPSPISDVLSNVSLQFVPCDSFCAFLHPSCSGTLCPSLPFSSCFCVIPVLFTLQGEPGNAVGYFNVVRAPCSHKDRREAVQSHSSSLSRNVACTQVTMTKQLWLL